MRLSIIITIIVSIITISCSDDGSSTTPIQQGDLNQPCYPNETCNEGLICADDVCTDKAADTCGNGFIEPGETCDGTNFGVNSCEGLGYDAGFLTCNADCTVSDSTCRFFECGNGFADPGEECDSTTTLSCLDFGFLQEGEVTCGDDCIADTSACPATCGDGMLTGDEACETINGTFTLPDGEENLACYYYCTDLGFLPRGDGVASCDNSCEIDFSQCHCM